jgi:signal transduction histidine kinase
VKTVLAFVGAVIVGLAVFEITMRPSGAERTDLLLVFAGVAVGVAAAGLLLTRATLRFRSLRTAVLLVALAAVVAVGVATVVSAKLMFLDSHDLNLLFVVLGFGSLLGLVLALTLTRPLAADLGRIRDTARRVAAGDLDAGTGVDRPDEVGSVAAAVDSMVGQLAAAAADRERNEESRRAFLAAVGHDLRSPLAALAAAIEALEDGLADDPDRYLRSMRADIDAMSELVEDLFLLARIEAGRLEFAREVVDLAEIADESIEALAPVARAKDIRLQLDAAGPVFVSGGPAALGRVVRNLVDNAIRHAPAGSRVLVRVSEDGGATVRVVDDGPGFAPEMVTAAFDSLVTGDPARSRAHGGAGLGLTIAKGIVAVHGGEIWAEPGPGGQVGFRIPAAG